jgi:hypothetical protein
MALSIMENPNMATVAEAGAAKKTIPCRLCGGESHAVFDKLVLDRHTVSYFRCATCGSLETETPYWLQQAYAEQDDEGTNNLADLDTGAAQRNLLTLAGTLVTAQMLGLKNVVDIGGGDGLLCRLLRDYGLNAYVSDRYAAATYARGFTTPDFDVPDLVTAFEVLEHFADPANDLVTIFGKDPAAVLISTDIYDGYGADWPYLTAQTGQHVFFYSRRGSQLIAERFGYRVLHAGFFTLFYKPHFGGRRITMLSYLLRNKPLMAFRAWLAFKPAHGAWRDADRLRRYETPSLSAPDAR